MVTASRATHFRDLGVPLIPLDEGTRAFVTDLGTADDQACLLLAGSAVRSAAGNGRAGDVLGNGPSRLVVEATVGAGTHGFLADHAPAGVPVLPLAMAMEWFACAGRSRHPDRSISLADIRVLHRIELPDLATGGHRFSVAGTGAGRDDALDLVLTSSTGTAHYRARLIAPNVPPQRWDAPDPADEPFTESSIYQAAALFHGPAFQVLRGVRGMSRQSAEARVVGVRGMGWPGGPWWTDPAAVDGALQTAVLWASHATGDATLPMGVDALRVHRTGPAPGTLRCLVRATSITTDRTRCDVALLDEHGVRTELLGVSLIRRPDMNA